MLLWSKHLNFRNVHQGLSLTEGIVVLAFAIFWKLYHHLRLKKKEKILWKKTLFVTKPFQSQDLISNSIYFLLFNYFDATCSSENLVLDQLIINIFQLIFFYNLITCLLDIVLILWGENLSWILLIFIFFILRSNIAVEHVMMQT